MWKFTHLGGFFGGLFCLVGFGVFFWLFFFLGGVVLLFASLGFVLGVGGRWFVFCFNYKLQKKDPHFFLYLASVQSLVEQPWLWSCPYSTTALHRGKKLSQHQRSSVDNSHLPPELSGGPKHLTGKDITVLGLGWRDICSYQAAWSISRLLTVWLKLTPALHVVHVVAKMDVSHTAWMPGRRQQCIIPCPCPGQKVPQAASGWWAVISSEVTFRTWTVWGFTTITWNNAIDRKITFPCFFTHKHIIFLFTELKPLKRQCSGNLLC